MSVGSIKQTNCKVKMFKRKKLNQFFSETNQLYSWSVLGCHGTLLLLTGMVLERCHLHHSRAVCTVLEFVVVENNELELRMHSVQYLGELFHEKRIWCESGPTFRQWEMIEIKALNCKVDYGVIVREILNLHFNHFKSSHEQRGFMV